MKEYEKKQPHYSVWGTVEGYTHGKPRSNCRCTQQAYCAADGKKVVGVLKKGHFLDTFGNFVENAQETVLEIRFLAAVIYNSKCLEWRLLGQTNGKEIR